MIPQHARPRAQGASVPLPGQPRPQQQGVALIMALVVLLVIALSSVAVIRGSMNADLVAQNTRMQNFATQSAQWALRYCEAQLVLAEEQRVIELHSAATPAHWEDFDNGSDGGLAATLPDDWRQTADSSVVAATPPQCLVELSSFNASVYVVTSRGFSPDFSADADGRTLSGSVVWLQSQVAVGSGS